MKEQAQVDHLENFYSHSTVDWSQEIDFPNSRTFRQFSHRMFNRYPARSISLVPRAILSDLVQQYDSEESLSVLDPFMGSGTTAVEGALLGLDVYGTEIDPFARLLAAVRVSNFSEKDLIQLEKLFQSIQSNWEKQEPNTKLRPQLENVEYWFDSKNFLNLLKLKTTIYKRVKDDSKVLDFFRVVLADMVRPCSLAERQTLKPYISSKYKKVPAKVDEAFAKSFLSHFSALQEFSRFAPKKSSRINWLGDDGTNFNSKKKIDVAITSPPYINALDYIRCIKIESAWAGCGNDQIYSEMRPRQVGEARPVDFSISKELEKLVGKYVKKISKVDSRRAQVVLGYFHDMYRNLDSVSRALKKGGEYHLIVGDSVVREVEVPTHTLIAETSRLVGFDWVGYYFYKIKDHRTSIPRGDQGGKIAIEHIISLKKV